MWVLEVGMGLIVVMIFVLIGAFVYTKRKTGRMIAEVYRRYNERESEF